MTYTLYQGDCLDVLPTLAAGSVDAVITDPPYGLNKAAWDDIFPVAWIQYAWKLTPRMLVMTGSSVIQEAANALGNYQDCVVLYSRNGMTKSKIAFGNYFPVLACGDWDWQARPNVLAYNVSLDEAIDHPSPKPLAAMRLLIKHYTKPGQTVLDPFMGSGSTGVAAIMEGRNFIGIELDARYYRIAERRIANAQPPLFVADAPAVSEPEQAAMFSQEAHP